jgi:hypothetical protein
MPKINTRQLAFSPEDLRRILPLGRSGCYRLAREIGKRFGGKILVPKVALDAWLNEPSSAVPNSKKKTASRSGAVP